MMLVLKHLLLKYVLKTSPENLYLVYAKNIFTVAAHCWCIKDAFAGFCLQIFEK